MGEDEGEEAAATSKIEGPPGGEGEVEQDNRMPQVDDKEYNYFDEDFERLLRENSFKGAVDDWTVIDTDFRKRTRSSLGSYEAEPSRGSRNSKNSDEWVVDMNAGAGDGEFVMRPNADSGRLSLGMMSGDGQESYVEFFCRLSSDSMTIWLFRRFSEFEKLEAQLRKGLKSDKSPTGIPALPAKQVFSFSGRWKERKFVEQRRQLLDAWIKAIMVIQSKGGKNVQEAFKAFVQGSS